jgi:hypothetical protein
MLKLLFGTDDNLVVCQTAALSAESMMVQRPGPISTDKSLQPMCGGTMEQRSLEVLVVSVR